MVEIVVFETGWVTLSANVTGNWGPPPTTVGDRKLDAQDYHAALFA